MLDSLKFKDTKGNRFKIRIDNDRFRNNYYSNNYYSNNYYDTTDNFPDNEELQKNMADTINNDEASFFYLTLYKGNIDEFEFEEIDLLGGIFAEYNQQGKESLNTALKELLKKNNIEKSIIDDISIGIDKYGYLSLKSKKKTN